MHLEEDSVDDGRNTDDDGDIRDIEYRPYTEIKEVDDMSDAHTVDQIAQGAAEQKRHSPAKDAALAADIRREYADENEDDDAHDDKKRALMGENAEGSARIQDECDMEDVLYDGKRHARKHLVNDKELHDLIQDNDADT